MVPTIDITPTTASDLPHLKQVLETSELFPPDLLEPMIAPYFAGGTAEIWITARQHGHAVGFAYAVPERMTEGTWNLLAIAVDASAQRHGIGTALMRHVETLLADSDQRLLIVETSGLDDYASTRRFYHRLGYAEAAQIRDFYQAGEDKVIFTRPLA